MYRKITSLQNPLIKTIVRLQEKSAERNFTGSFVAEGRREVSMALQNKFEVKNLIICPELFTADPLYPIAIDSVEMEKLLEVSVEVYNKVAYRENAEGILMIGISMRQTLTGLGCENASLILLLEGVEKPGNLGAILRTTDAARFDAILLCDSRVDIFNPNAIRASLGCVFNQNIIPCSNEEAFAWIESRGLNVFAASPDTPFVYHQTDLRQPCVLAFGAEDKGLSPFWLQKASKVIKIPMAGQIDSLNVGVSVAIIAFEALRQRQTAPETPSL